MLKNPQRLRSLKKGGWLEIHCKIQFGLNLMEEIQKTILDSKNSNAMLFKKRPINGFNYFGKIYPIKWNLEVVKF